MNVPDTSRHAAKEVIFESYPILGYNYRMTDIQAAVGREQLRRLNEITARRRFLSERYKELLTKCSAIELPREPDWARSNWQSFCVRLAERYDQKQVMQKMLDLGISTRRGIMCAHREAAYTPETWSCGARRDLCNCAHDTCENLRASEEAQDHAIILPLFHDMTLEDQDLVVGALRTACA
jgi:dTDP-4-amino-4,6-dideoxygalactose transaminase